MSRNERNERSTTAIRFPAEMHDKLRAASEAHGLPVNYLVVKAVQEFLQYLPPPEELLLTKREPTPPTGR